MRGEEANIHSLVWPIFVFGHVLIVSATWKQETVNSKRG